MDEIYSWKFSREIDLLLLASLSVVYFLEIKTSSSFGEKITRSTLLWIRDSPLLLAFLSSERTWGSFFIIILALIWRSYGILFLDSKGLIKALFDMELIKGLEKITRWRHEIRDFSEIQFLFQMEAPDSLEEFNKQLREHFSRFPRFGSKYVTVGGEIFFKKLSPDSPFIAN